MTHEPGIQPVQKLDTPVGLFRGNCSCGWVSQGFGSESDARKAGKAHADAKNADAKAHADAVQARKDAGQTP